MAGSKPGGTDLPSTRPAPRQPRLCLVQDLPLGYRLSSGCAGDVFEFRRGLHDPAVSVRQFDRYGVAVYVDLGEAPQGGVFAHGVLPDAEACVVSA